MYCTVIVLFLWDQVDSEMTAEGKRCPAGIGSKVPDAPARILLSSIHMMSYDDHVCTCIKLSWDGDGEPVTDVLPAED